MFINFVVMVKEAFFKLNFNFVSVFNSSSSKKTSSKNKNKIINKSSVVAICVIVYK